MKNINFLILALFFLLQMSCGTSAPIAQNNDVRQTNGQIENPDVAVSLTEHLRKISGIYVRGNGRNAQITIRGAASMTSGTEPLFVVDGRVISGGFQTVVEFVSVASIDKIRVLKNVSETGFYGANGANGVIEINLKK